MGSYEDAEEILRIYNNQTERQIIELNKTIVALRSKITYLEKEIEAASKIPVPKTVIQQIIELEARNRKLQSDIDYYKKHLPVQVIINRENKEKSTRKGGIPK